MDSVCLIKTGKSFHKNGAKTLNMYMFSRYRKLDFYKIIYFISGLKCLQKL